MTNAFITLLTITTCFGVTTSAFADDARHNSNAAVAAASFATLDRNGDQRISRSEAGFDRVLSLTFAEIDTDGDGYVTNVEFAAAEANRTTVSKLGKEVKRSPAQ